MQKPKATDAVGVCFGLCLIKLTQFEAQTLFQYFNEQSEKRKNIKEKEMKRNQLSKHMKF